MPNLTSNRLSHVGNKQILTIAIPVIFSNITTPLVGIADIAVIGHAILPIGINSAAATGAVAFGSMIFSLIFGSLGFFKMGTSGFSAQAKGASDMGELAAIFIRVILLGFLMGLVIIMLRQPLIQLVLYFSNTSEQVAILSAKYYNMRALAAPFTLINFAILGWLMGQGRANLGLLVQIILNASNILLNLFFVIHLEMGVKGVAMASAIAEIIAFIAALILILAIYKPSFFKRPLSQILHRAKMLRMFNVNRDIMIRSMALTASFTWFTIQSANMGDTLLAANAILIQFLAVFSYFLDGFATASEVYVGQAVGAKQQSIFERAFKLSLTWAFIMAVILAILVLIFGNQAISFMSQDVKVNLAANQYLIWPAIAVIIGAWCYTVDGVFIGATRGGDMRNMMLLSLAVYLFAWFILVHIWGNHGHWAAFALMLLTRGISLHAKMPQLRNDIFKQP